MSHEDFEVHEVDQDRWDDLAALFDSRGGPKYCWCMAWRTASRTAKRAKGAKRNAALKAELHARVAAGVPIGILGYADGTPIAWCSIAPRTTYRPLGGPDGAANDGEAVWSLVCFFVKRAFRGQGVANRLIDAAVTVARRNGATIVEAYPVDPSSPSYQFMGFVPQFERAGFEKVGTAGTRRHVMRLKLD